MASVSWFVHRARNGAPVGARQEGGCPAAQARVGVDGRRWRESSVQSSARSHAAGAASPVGRAGRGEAQARRQPPARAGPRIVILRCRDRAKAGRGFCRRDQGIPIPAARSRSGIRLSQVLAAGWARGKDHPASRECGQARTRCLVHAGRMSSTMPASNPVRGSGWATRRSTVLVTGGCDDVVSGYRP